MFTTFCEVKTMVKARPAISSVRWSDKNKYYLEQVGLLDGRTGKKRREGDSISQFINQMVTMVFECAKNPLGVKSTPKELEEAWLAHSMFIKNKELLRVQDDLDKIRNNLRVVRGVPPVEEDLEDLQLQLTIESRGDL